MQVVEVCDVIFGINLYEETRAAKRTHSQKYSISKYSMVNGILK